MFLTDFVNAISNSVLKSVLASHWKYKLNDIHKY